MSEGGHDLSSLSLWQGASCVIDGVMYTLELYYGATIVVYDRKKATWKFVKGLDGLSDRIYHKPVMAILVGNMVILSGPILMVRALLLVPILMNFTSSFKLDFFGDFISFFEILQHTFGSRSYNSVSNPPLLVVHFLDVKLISSLGMAAPQLFKAATKSGNRFLLSSFTNKMALPCSPILEALPITCMYSLMVLGMSNTITCLTTNRPTLGLESNDDICSLQCKQIVLIQEVPENYIIPALLTLFYTPTIYNIQ
ncbi:hypothetical protein EUTSA_v10028906mg [Eutrema salsugineum]|uniref:Uncharacterized protein n=1 Tax=Eutrema salsugineum TaxID=72664 RepID=V4L5R2_EUTSA|nr:hypothetical protein EUTSA_v10028906mg [Eutrema salsugineum]